MIKFTQEKNGATASINDGIETYYTRYAINTADDVEQIADDFAARYDGGGSEDVTAIITIIKSRSRKYPAGKRIRFTF